MLHNKRKFNPPKEDLERLVWEIPTLHVAKMFGVSDKAIDKRCKLLGIQKPGRGYWAKLKAAQKTSLSSTPVQLTNIVEVPGVIEIVQAV